MPCFFRNWREDILFLELAKVEEKEVFVKLLLEDDS